MKFQTVGDVCELVTDGTHYTPPNAGSGVPFLTVKDMSEDGLDFVNCSKISADDFASADAGNSSPKPGDVLFSKDGTVGKVRVVTDHRDFAVLSSIAILRPKRDVCDPQYLGHALKSPSIIEQAARSKTGSAIRRVILSDLRRLNFPLPPLDEQRRIAAILDKADELRTKRREALAHLDTLTQSTFHSMFGDPTVVPQQRALRELLASIDSGSSPVSADRPAEKDEWGILKLSAVTSQTYLETENKALLATAPDTRHEVRTGDVLFTRKNTPNLVAAVAMVRHTRSKLLLPDLIFRLNIADQQILEPEYLHAVMSYPTKRAAIQRLAGGAAASMSNISKAKLLTVSIPVPPLELQQTFATRVAAVERLKELHRKHLAELDALFASLQHRAFKGEL